MICDLQKLYKGILSRVPKDEDDDIILDRRNLPVPAAHLCTDKIVTEKRHHDYNTCFRADFLILYGGKRTLRLLGLHILAVIFHKDSSESVLELTHPETDIRHLIIEFEYPDERDPAIGLSVRPLCFRYFPSQPQKHPWLNSYDSNLDLPLFELTNRSRCVASEEEWIKRDTIYGVGTLEGSIKFAELLLNAGRSDSTVADYELEGDAGFRGVAPMSAKLRICLPGSLPWPHRGRLTP